MNAKSSTNIAIWLLCGCSLIFLMVVIGGITRLTGSGLSITEWKPIMGAIPPMTEAEWQRAFDQYRQIPQFKLINSHFALKDFKSVFWWEYIHRLLGRLIGIVFIIPFLFFLLTKKLDPRMIRKTLFLFFLGGLQGLLGWYMVKSGLSERTSVSHLRLAIHLIAAFITFGFTFWFALELLYPGVSNAKQHAYTKKIPLTILLLIVIQIIYGAFVAGLHAGKIYNTFPLMDGQFIPSGIGTLLPRWKNSYDNPVTVQFLHRILAFVILVLISFVWWKSRRLPLNREQQLSIHLLVCAVAVQFILGVFTILYQVPVVLASGHQLGAFFLFACSIFVLFHFRGRENNADENKESAVADLPAVNR